MRRDNRPDRGAAETIASGLDGLGFDDLSPAVVDRVVAAFVDTVGVGLAGTQTEAGRIAAETVAGEPGIGAGAHLFTGTDRAPVTAAGFANGVAAHALDFDDVSDAMIGHPSACLVPAILAIAEDVEASGASAIVAYVAGFEAEAALAGPINPGHYQRGWHATSTLGTFGAAAAAATVLGLSRAELATALDLAASMPAGLKRNFGTMAKPMHVGAAVRSGLTAALLAANGFDAADDAIDGPGGFFDLYGPPDGATGPVEVPPEPGASILAFGLDEKKYPCCYFAHTAIDASLEVADQLDRAAEPVDTVRVRASRGAGDALIHPEPRTPFEARFSMEHVVAHALAYGRVGPEAFAPDRLTDASVAELRDRVDFAVDDGLPYESYAATVTVRTRAGAVLEAGHEHPPGSSQRPLTPAERQHKFEQCATAVVDRDTAAALYDRLDALAEEPVATAFLDRLGA